MNSDGSGFISISNWAPGLFDNGVPRYSEIQRTAKYRIVSGSQRDGWNYARVLHVGDWGTRATNYIEWIVDGNADALASAGNGLTIFGDDSFSYISGVKYFNSPSGSILTRISNIYKNVYSDSSSAISFTNTPSNEICPEEGKYSYSNKLNDDCSNSSLNVFVDGL